MQLRRLAALEQTKIRDERDTLEKEAARLREILSDEKNIRAVIHEEILDVSSRFGDKRRTKITGESILLDREDLIEDKPVLVSITTQNYIKRIDLDTYRQQRRGGKGIAGMTTKDEDAVDNVFVADMHDYLLCFTDAGRLHWLKVYDVPEGSRTAKGKPIVNLLNIQDELVTAIIPIREFRPDHFILFATRSGQVVKVPLDEFSRPRASGINAIKLREGDTLVDVRQTDGTMELILTTRKGQSLRFHEQSVRPVGRGAMGVRGIKLRSGDLLQVVTVVRPGHLLLTVTARGYGKRTEFDEFRGHGRGTMGVRNILTDRGSDEVVTTRSVEEDDEIILMSASGNVMRTKVSDISVQKRSTRGVRVMALNEGDKLIGLAVLKKEIEPSEIPDDPGSLAGNQEQ
jgi:DNA gyrase subunit A